MKSSTTTKVLHQSWLPIMTAMLISLSGGYILDNMVEKFANIVVFQPVINGVGGNLVAVQVHIYIFHFKFEILNLQGNI